MSADEDEFLHPAYLLKQATDMILAATFGDYRTTVDAATPEPVRMMARKLAFAAYASHLFPNARSISFIADCDDDAAIAMMLAAQWMSAAGHVRCSFGADVSVVEEQVHVNDPFLHRAGDFTSEPRRDQFAKDFDPVQLRHMRTHLKQSAARLRSYGFTGGVASLASQAGGVWVNVANSLMYERGV